MLPSSPSADILYIAFSDCRPSGRQFFSIVGQPSGRTSLPVKSVKKGSPAGAQRSGSCGERRSSGTDELSMQAGEGRDVEPATTQGCTSCSPVPLRPKSRPCKRGTGKEHDITSCSFPVLGDQISSLDSVSSGSVSSGLAVSARRTALALEDSTRLMALRIW